MTTIEKLNKWYEQCGTNPPVGEVITAFEKAMQGCNYGVEETHDAFCWFSKGYELNKPKITDLQPISKLIIDDFKGYERTPIQIGNNVIMLLQMFTNNSSTIQDCWTFELLEEQHYNQYRNAARQFMLQLEGQYCMAFLMALQDQINVEIEEWRERCRESREKIGNSDDIRYFEAKLAQTTDPTAKKKYEQMIELLKQCDELTKSTVSK